jgi:uncharacterized membrane protein
MPDWALVIAYWLHMAATIVWIGGLFFQAVVLPASMSMENLNLSQQGKFLERLRKRFEPLAWLSLFILVGTGLVQMSANPQYNGFLSINTRWASAMLAKHIAVGVMVLVAAIQTWVIQPRLNRALIQLARSRGGPDELIPLQRRQKNLRQINFLIALIVLVFTAIARSS